MRNLALSSLVLAAFFVAPFNCLAAAEPLGQTQLREFFQWVKVDGNGLEFETKLHRGFSILSNLPHQGPVWFLHFGASLDIAYAAGAVKITPKNDGNGPYFEAQCFDAARFVATTPRSRYILRPVSTPQGPALEIEEEAGT
ncbi:MAG TPA: hypothetical protein VHY09_03350 [Candidatus Methylacidiphilales bacterium]|jgi:hypothetical protein|nr:hypothetical protein [Candidatus Methylacidiphilales bacterium]